MASLIEAFDDTADEETPHCFVAYTIKVWNLPLAGHKDNHAGLVNPAQVTAFKARYGIRDGHEWDFDAGLEIEPATIKRFLARVPAALRRAAFRLDRETLAARDLAHAVRQDVNAGRFRQNHE